MKVELLQLTNIYVLASKYLSGFISYHFPLKNWAPANFQSLFLQPAIPLPTALASQTLSQLSSITASRSSLPQAQQPSDGNFQHLLGPRPMC